MRKSGIIMVLLLSLLLVNGAVWQKESLLQHGQLVRLALMPVNPRALKQRNYMALTYALNAGVCWKQIPRHGRLVITLDGRQVATAAVWDHGQPLRARQRYLLSHQDHHGISVANDVWFFQQGRGRHFVTARYAELRVAADGTALLTGVLDAHFRPLNKTP